MLVGSTGGGARHVSQATVPCLWIWRGLLIGHVSQDTLLRDANPHPWEAPTPMVQIPELDGIPMLHLRAQGEMNTAMEEQGRGW